MSQSAGFRRLVVARAGGACEYCRLSQAAAGVTFHIEHILPESHGGETVMSNLALSCPGCNLSKGEQTTGFDVNGRKQPLLNPRRYEPARLGWELHFSLDRRSGRIAPRTPIGEATVDGLNMNERLRVTARRLQLRAGLIG